MESLLMKINRNIPTHIDEDDILVDLLYISNWPNYALRLQHDHDCNNIMDVKGYDQEIA